jgi:serine phosphatase RsbU (regulator of sigma subunit)/ligand-binding sensor domain-containing protein
MKPQQKILSFLLSVTFLTFNCFSQNQESVVIDRVNTKNLSNTFVTSLFQDQKGFLWVGTLSGLNRYDGYIFTAYHSFQNDKTTLSNPSVSSMVQLDADRLLIATAKGLNIYNYSTDRFKRIYADDQPGSEKINSINCISSNNTVNRILGTQNGVYILNDNEQKIEPVIYKNQPLLAGWRVQSLCVDRLNNLWIGASMVLAGNVISKIYKFSSSKKELKEIVTTNMGTNGHKGISEDYLGNLWVSADNGLLSINPNNFDTAFYRAPNGFYSNVSYYHTKDNVIWQCYWSFGLTAFDIDKKEFKIYKNNPDNSKSLMSNKCWALFKDDNDILWIGSDVGLQKITNRRPNLEVVKKNYQNPKFSFPANRLSAVLASKKHNNIIYAGIDGEGFSIYDRLNKISINFGPNCSNKNTERFVNAFYEDDDGTVYIAGQNNFHKLTRANGKYTAKTFLNYQQHNLQSIIADPYNKNILWIGGNNEVLKFNKMTEEFIPIGTDNGENNIYFSAFIFNNEIYFTHKNGLTKINTFNEKFEQIKLPDIGSISNNKTLNDTTVLLFSQYVGLCKFYPKTKTYDIVYKTKNELFPEIHDAIKYKNVLWMATSQGLIKWNTFTNEMSEVTVDDGLPSDIIHHLDLLDGYFYLSTQDGLVIFNPNYQVSHFNLPKVVITQITGLGSNFSLKNITNGAEVKLRGSQNTFKIDFTLLDFNLPEKNTFKFRFLPIEKEWQQPLSTHYVIYNDLNAGDYQFELMGANVDQNWSAEPFIIKIKIVPPFYKSRWFFILILSIIIISTLVTITYRTRLNIRRQNELERIIKERTAEIQEKRAELMDSITYAERIQKAIIVGEETLNVTIANNFIYYEPKDKVSGDFFWIGKFKDYLIVFAGDCTGHGVPGAMLSIVGTALLNKIVYEEGCYLPGDILTRLNNLFFNQLHLKNSEIRDGMDASAFTLNLLNNTVYFSGAKNDAYYIVNDKLVDLKSQRNSIGEDGDTKFDTIELSYEPNRFLYLLSDGVKDQFGGPREKKLSAMRFKQILLQTSHLPAPEQKKFIAETIKNWKAGLPQTDDMMVIGFKF